MNRQRKRLGAAVTAVATGAIVLLGGQSAASALPPSPSSGECQTQNPPPYCTGGGTLNVQNIQVTYNDGQVVTARYTGSVWGLFSGDADDRTKELGEKSGLACSRSWRNVFCD